MLGQLRGWQARRWVAVAVGAVTTGLVVGIPTDVVPTPWFTRMTPVLWWNYPTWVATAVLAGLTLATYVRSPDPNRREGRLLGGSIVSVFAIGCPICNKLVVLLLGLSGALTWFAPVQPYLAVLSVALLAFGLRQRLRGELSCAVQPGPAAPDRTAEAAEHRSLRGGDAT